MAGQLLDHSQPVITYRHLRRIAKAMALDAAILVVAYAAAFSVSAALTAANGPESAWLVALAVIATLIVQYAFGVYHRIWSMTSGHDVVVLVQGVAAVGMLVLLADVALPRPLPLSVVLLSSVLSLIGLVGVRYRSRLVSGARWRWKAIWDYKFPRMVTRVLIVGAGEAGQVVAWRLKHRFPNHEYHYEVAGFVDDDPEKQGMFVEGCRVLGTRYDIPDLTERLKIDLIAFAMTNVPGADFREILTLCESTRARIKVVPDVFALMKSKIGTGLLRDVQPEDLIGRSAVARQGGIDLERVTDRVTLVTGAAGSIGSELCRQLCDYDVEELILLDNNESGLHELGVELAARYPYLKLTPVLGDITTSDALRRIFMEYRPQIVFHAAAYKHVPMLESFPNEALRVNIGGTRKLAEICQEFGVERFVLISTDKAVNPTSVMGASKRVCELLLRALSQRPGNRTLFTSVRFGNVLGSRGSVVPAFNQQIDGGGPVTITHPNMVRYFMSIAEAANLVIHAACLTRGDDVFVLKMGEMVRIVDLAERMIRLRGLRPYVDIEIKFTGVRPGEKLYEELHSENEIVLDTAHPHISQLKSLDKGIEAELFLKRLEEMTRRGGEFGPGTLSTLISTSSEDPARIVSVNYAVAS